MTPIIGTYPEFFGAYISKVTETDLHRAFDNYRKHIFTFIKSIPESKGDHAYAVGKWTIKQLILHVSDSERIFSYRALRFARGDDQQPLPFEEDLYAANCDADKRTLASVIEEYEAVNNATILLFNSFSDNVLSKKGNTALGTITVNALGFVICGHAIHHVNILKERYLNK